MIGRAAGALIAAAVFAAPAAAADVRELCPERPGLTTPACTVDAGHVLVEVGLADWTLEKAAGARVDTLLLGSTLARIGVGDTLELQIGWTPLGFTRDREPGLTPARSWRAGDATLGAKLNLMNPDGEGIALALRPQVSLPIGRRPVGAGTWSASMLVPFTADLGGPLHLGLTPEVDAEADEDGSGRHLSWGGAAGLEIDVSDAVSASTDLRLLRDRNPAGHVTEALAGFAAAWQPSDDFQLDAGTAIGLNHDTADLELSVGISRRF